MIFFSVILSIIIWGGVTNWRFMTKKEEYFKDSSIPIKFISYADDRFNRKDGKYIKTQDKMTKLFENH